MMVAAAHHAMMAHQGLAVAAAAEEARRGMMHGPPKTGFKGRLLISTSLLTKHKFADKQEGVWWGAVGECLWLASVEWGELESTAAQLPGFWVQQTPTKVPQPTSFSSSPHIQ
jgi:hypothetical protein